MLTPFFFLRSGMNVSVPLVWANLGLLGLLLAVKLAAEVRRRLPAGAPHPVEVIRYVGRPKPVAHTT
jgi:hypothetical protein